MVIHCRIDDCRLMENLSFQFELKDLKFEPQNLSFAFELGFSRHYYDVKVSNTHVRGECRVAQSAR